MPEVENGDVSLHYELSGAPDGSVLVLSNSLGSNLQMWDKVLPAFENSHRVLRYDMRGHGQSSVPEGPYNMEQLGGDVLYLLDHLGIERADVCGLSVGGLIAMWLGVHSPQRLHRIIFANTGGRIGTVELWGQRIAMAQSAGMASLASFTLERWFTAPYRENHPDEMERISAMVAATEVRGYVACCAALRDTDLRSEVAAIAAPSLVISGTHDPATPPSDGKALHSALRNSSYVELNASHLSAWERSEEFANAVLAFLDGEQKHG